MPFLPLELQENSVWWRIQAYAVGSFWLLESAHHRVDNFGRNYPRCLSGFRIWGPDCGQEHVVCAAPQGSLYYSYGHSVDRFWFFAARNNPATAPLITWFTGGVSDADPLPMLRCSANHISPEVPACLGCFWRLVPAGSTTRAPESIRTRRRGIIMRTCTYLFSLTPSEHTSSMTGSGYSSISLSELASRTGTRQLVPLRKPLRTYGSSYKSGSRTRDSRSMLLEILESGRNHMADTTVLHSPRASHDLIFLNHSL